MQALFLSPKEAPRPRWLSAFPDLQCFESADQILQFPPGDVLVWVNLDALLPVEADERGDGRQDKPEDKAAGAAGARVSDSPAENAADKAIALLVDAGHKVVALSGYPRQAQAFALLAKGVRGYCHVDCAPRQFLEVAQVVASGALWMPPELVQRLASVGQRLDNPKTPASREHFAMFTPREERVALMVGRGFNNREIAAALDVSERTVKAHLTTIFEKLGLRDRVQLALYVNRLPIH